MEEKIIDLGFDEYQSVIKLIKSNQQKIYFRCKGTASIISIDNKAKDKQSNEKNIVEKWMEDIVTMSEEGFYNASDSSAEREFAKIKSYCQAVIVAVTS